MSIVFVHTQLNIKTVFFLFQVIQFSIWTLLSSIWLIDTSLSGDTTPDQSRPGRDGSEEVLLIPQYYSPSDCLVSYPGHSLGGGLTPHLLQRCSRSNIQPQPTRQDKFTLINHLVGRVFANGSEDLGSTPGRVIPKTLKVALDTSLLNTQKCKLRIKGKVEQSRKRISTLPYTSV